MKRITSILYGMTGILAAAFLLTACTDGVQPAETAGVETTAAETAAPETTAPETAAPETTAPETTAPETTAPLPETSGAPADMTTPEVKNVTQQEETEEMRPEEDITYVRVAIRLTDPSVTEKGFAMSEVSTNQEAKDYRAWLEEQQTEIIRQIEAYTGEPLDVRWQFTLSTNVISANVRVQDLEWIRALEGVADVTEEGTVEPLGPVKPDM